MDWPAVRPALDLLLLSDDEPLPVELADLGQQPESLAGAVRSQILWERINAEQLERLVEQLLRRAPEYEDVQRLMHTNAADCQPTAA